MSLCVNMNLQKSLKYMFLKLIYLKLVTFCLTITLLPELLACAQFFFIKMTKSPNFLDSFSIIFIVL